MLNGVFVKNYPAPEANIREILRYAGQKEEADENVLRLLNDCLAESADAVSCRVCYRVMTVEEAFALFKTESKLFFRKLCGAAYVAAFAATVGIGLDSLLLRYAESSPSKALMLQAIGAERIESLCDAFCGEIEAGCEKRGMFARPRFSAGYGDFPIEAQRTFFEILDCPRKIGLTLNESLLMTPTKSVTALVAIGRSEERTGKDCAECGKTDCDFRKG